MAGPGFVRLMRYSLSTVLLQASFSVEIQVVLAHRVCELPFCQYFFFFIFYFFFRPNVQFHCDILYDPFLYMEEHKKIYCMFFSSCLPVPSSLKFLYSLHNYDVRIFSHDPNSMEACHGFVFLLKDRTTYWLLYQISLMTIQNTSPMTIH